MDIDKYWILDGKTPIPADLKTWAEWFETHFQERIVKKDIIDGLYISTVFLGLDHRFYDVGPPILFETMVFSKEEDLIKDRYCTWEQAEKGHGEIVKEHLAKSVTPN